MPSAKRQKKDSQPLSFDSMVSYLRSTIAGFPDKRTGSNCRYSIEDAALGAFSLFFTQSPSFLSFQENMLKNKGISNAQTLFDMDQYFEQPRKLLRPSAHGKERLYKRLRVQLRLVLIELLAMSPWKMKPEQEGPMVLLQY